ncbi:hypothetical protein Q7I33_18850 [Aeromonas allosaccharophila]|uniref:hypothetical protein n=1 Tax=Aeromonas TaxID=642 RepID=UPI003005BA18
MPTIQLPTPIYVALEVDKLNNFTISECLKSGYGEKSNSYRNAREYSYIYIQVMKLVSFGLLRRIFNGRYVRFVKTEEYVNATIELISIPVDETKAPQIEVLSRLQARYCDYENKIQSLWGEWREYDELADLYPQFESPIIVASNQVNKKINTILGRLNAVKIIIEALEKENESNTATK